MTEQTASGFATVSRDGTQSDATSVTQSVVTRLADHKECEPTALPPLFEAVDPDALERLVSTADANLTVQFRYAGRTVTVENEPDGGVAVRLRK